MPLSIHLITQRFLPHDFAACQRQLQIARLRHANLLCARKLQRNLLVVLMRPDDEIVLQLLLALTAVVEQIYAPVDVFVAHFAEVTDIGAPLTFIVADEVVAHARLFRFACCLRVGIGVPQCHA